MHGCDFGLQRRRLLLLLLSHQVVKKEVSKLALLCMNVIMVQTIAELPRKCLREFDLMSMKPYPCPTHSIMPRLRLSTIAQWHFATVGWVGASQFGHMCDCIGFAYDGGLHVDED